MTTFALGLVVIAAALHAAWNFLAKRGEDHLAFIWWTGVAGTIVLAPIAIWISPWPASSVES